MPDTELFRLPPAERIRCYRNLAGDARRLAQSAVYLERRMLLLVLAHQWEGLAGNLESQAAARAVPAAAE
jgi:hypothetical protein